MARSKATDVSCWPLNIHEPLPSWTRGKIILIGDAAHPVRPSLICVHSESDVFQMLPFGGQGSNQAIEDAGALGYMLDGLENTNDIQKRLELFETVRRKRASRVQILSRVRVGKEKDVMQELLEYADPPGSGAFFLARFDSTIC